MARVLSLGLAVAAAFTLAGCQFIREDINRTLGRSPEDRARRTDIAASQITQIGVNAYLWRASLDTLSFLPLTSADPFGGVIISEWYVAPSSPNERLKVTVYIMDRALRADGLKVVVFRQVKAPAGWADATPSPDTAHKLEDSILTRARELRLATLGQVG